MKYSTFFKEGILNENNLCGQKVKSVAWLLS